MNLQAENLSQRCPITGIPVYAYLRINTARNIMPPGFYASEWEISEEAKEAAKKAAKEKVVKKFRGPAIRRDYYAENYLQNKEKKHQYYLKRKAKQCKTQKLNGAAL